MRIAARAEHADEAFGGGAGCLGEVFPADGGFDVVSEDDFPGFQVSGEELVDGFVEEGGGEGGVGGGAGLDQVFEAAG